MRRRKFFTSLVIVLCLPILAFFLGRREQLRRDLLVLWVENVPGNDYEVLDQVQELDGRNEDLLFRVAVSRAALNRRKAALGRLNWQVLSRSFFLYETPKTQSLDAKQSEAIRKLKTNFEDSFAVLAERLAQNPDSQRARDDFVIGCKLLRMTSPVARRAKQAEVREGLEAWAATEASSDPDFIDFSTTMPGLAQPAYICDRIPLAHQQSLYSSLIRVISAASPEQRRRLAAKLFGVHDFVKANTGQLIYQSLREGVLTEWEALVLLFWSQSFEELTCEQQQRLLLSDSLDSRRLIFEYLSTLAVVKVGGIAKLQQQSLCQSRPPAAETPESIVELSNHSMKLQLLRALIRSSQTVPKWLWKDSDLLLSPMWQRLAWESLKNCPAESDANLLAAIFESSHNIQERDSATQRSVRLLFEGVVLTHAIDSSWRDLVSEMRCMRKDPSKAKQYLNRLREVLLPLVSKR